jgi:hypothetical protein
MYMITENLQVKLVDLGLLLLDTISTGKRMITESQLNMSCALITIHIVKDIIKKAKKTISRARWQRRTLCGIRYDRPFGSMKQWYLLPMYRCWRP